MRVLQGTNYFEDHGGGVEIVAGNLGRALARDPDMDLRWMAAGPADGLDFPGTLIPLAASNLTEDRLGFPLPLPGPRALRDIKAAVADADILLLHDALYPTNLAAARAARKLSRPVVFVQHVGEVPYTNPVLRLMMKTANRMIAAPALSKADQVVFISGITQSYFEGKARFRRAPLRIYNGIKDGIGTARRRDPVPPRNILFVGRFVQKKGLEVLRHIIPELPETRWTFCGRGDIDPTAWALPNLRVAGHLDAGELAAEYTKADLLVLPSVGEGLPLVVQEALAQGLPVLASDDLLIADPWLEAHLNTCPVDLGNPEQTALAWLNTIKDPEALVQPDPNAVQNRYSWENAARAYRTLLDQLTT